MFCSCRISTDKCVAHPSAIAELLVPCALKTGFLHYFNNILQRTMRCSVFNMKMLKEEMLHPILQQVVKTFHRVPTLLENSWKFDPPGKSIGF